MVSASAEPPVVYLKNVVLGTAPLLLSVKASSSPVSVIAFHPVRPTVFLLGFPDGTLAAYDAAGIIRRRSDDEVDGEIAHIFKLHRTTEKNASGSRSSAITGAAFLPGYKTRAISVGSDGRCRLVDFADGGIVLRTWHAKAPVTSIAVLAVKPLEKPSGAKGRRQSQRRSTSATIGGPTTINNFIAIGTSTGKVQLYDSVGLLLARKAVTESERIISVEWISGPSPRAISPTAIILDVSDAPSLTQKSSTLSKRASEVPALTSDLQSAQAKPVAPGPTITRRFTIHPDELDESTVRRSPKGKEPAVPHAKYPDLFSAVKPVGSGPRLRPRVTSQTFVTETAPRDAKLFPSGSSDSSRGAGTRVSAPDTKRKHLRWKSVPDKRPVRSKTRAVTDSVDTPALPDAQADIWVTSDEDTALQRPPARQTSRSRVGSRGTMSTIRGPTTTSVACEPSSPSTPHLPGGFDPVVSSGTDYYTALTHLSQDGNFSPASEHLRELFPRTSSIMPQREGTAKTPWAKTKQSRKSALSTKQTISKQSALGVDGALSSPSIERGHVSDQAPITARIRYLEERLAYLTRQNLTLKAILRKHGIFIPGS